MSRLYEHHTRLIVDGLMGELAAPFIPARTAGADAMDSVENPPGNCCDASTQADSTLESGSCSRVAVG